MKALSTAFDWNRAKAFLATAETGSLSAAARQLEVTQPTVGRQVAALEDELGLLLFHRVGNRLELTETGLELLAHVRAMGEAAVEFSLVASGQAASVEGSVAVTCSEAIAAFLLPPFIASLRRDFPGIEIELVVSNEVRDLRRREADIAIRNVAPNQPDLVGKRLPTASGGFYATPDYVASIGGIASRQDLAQAEVFAFDRTDVMIEALGHLGVELTRENFPVTTSNHLVQWEMCRRGLGICVMMADVGDPDPFVERVLPEVEMPVPMWLVAHRELRTNRRIRIVFDRLAEALGG